MNVHVAYRPKDQVILGVFSSQENAEEYRGRCSDSDRNIEISDHEVDRKLEDEPDDTEFSFDERGWIG